MRKRGRNRTTFSFFLQLLKCFINTPEHIQGKFRILINLFFSIFMFFPPWYQCTSMMYVQLEIWRRKEWNCKCVKVSQTNVTIEHFRAKPKVRGWDMRMMKKRFQFFCNVFNVHSQMEWYVHVASLEIVQNFSDFL